VLGIVLAVAVASTAAVGSSARSALARSSAEADGYTCQYRRAGVTVVIDGPEKSRGICSVFNHDFGGFSTYSHTGRAYCGVRMRILERKGPKFLAARDEGVCKAFNIHATSRAPGG